MPPAQTLADLDLSGQPDFRVDSFAVISYSDAVQTGPASVHGSVLAHGMLDNIELRLPPFPVRALQLGRFGGVWRAEFQGALGWAYLLERSDNLTQWRPASIRATADVPETPLTLADTNPPSGNSAYYRVRAEKP